MKNKREKTKERDSSPSFKYSYFIYITCKYHVINVKYILAYTLKVNNKICNLLSNSMIICSSMIVLSILLLYMCCEVDSIQRYSVLFG